MTSLAYSLLSRDPSLVSSFLPSSLPPFSPPSSLPPLSSLLSTSLLSSLLPPSFPPFSPPSSLPYSQVILTLQSSNPELLPAHSSICKVLRLLSKRMEGEGREIHALKMHTISFIVELCAQNGADNILKL